MEVETYDVVRGRDLQMKLDTQDPKKRSGGDLKAETYLQRTFFQSWDPKREVRVD